MLDDSFFLEIKHLLADWSTHLFARFIFLLAIIGNIYFVFIKYHKSKPKKYSELDIQTLIDRWNPQPLTTKVSSDHYALNPKVITSKYGKYIVADGKKCLNLVSYNFLGLNDETALEKAASEALVKYGVGTCGPRGFYGTIDIHLQLEERLAKFLKVEEAVLYSYGYSAVASAIPAYAKIGDVIFCDEGVHFAIQKGLSASRSNVRFFKHNDVQDLHRLLREQEEEDLKNPKKAKKIRRFLVLEALYVNYGDICPLKEIMILKKRYKVRLFLDECFSFGVLGKTGRGITEHLDIPSEDIDHISSSLENAISAYGGFCAGSTFIVDHQRLSGLGYCFSASLPSLQAATALAALDILESRPEIIDKLRTNCIQLHNSLIETGAMVVDGDPISPIKHLRFKQIILNEAEHARQLEKICDFAFEKGYALTSARHLKEEIRVIKSSIRLIINSSLEKQDIDNVSQMLKEAFEKYSKVE